jgi:hypothetical protein
MWWITYEWWIEKDVEGCGHDISSGTIPGSDYRGKSLSYDSLLLPRIAPGTYRSNVITHKVVYSVLYSDVWLYEDKCKNVHPVP